MFSGISLPPKGSQAKTQKISAGTGVPGEARCEKIKEKVAVSSRLVSLSLSLSLCVCKERLLLLVRVRACVRMYMCVRARARCLLTRKVYV